MPLIPSEENSETFGTDRASKIYWDSPYKTVTIFTVEFFAIIVSSLLTFLNQSNFYEARNQRL